MKSSLALTFALWISVVQSRVLEDVLATAFCIAGCADNEQCRQDCHTTAKNRTNVPQIAQPSLSNISLHCRDVNRLIIKHNPGLYVIETQSKSSDLWTHPKISNETIYESPNLTAGSEYRYRARKVSREGVAEPDMTPWLQTQSENFVPQQVKNVTVDRIVERENNPGELQTYLNIEPADDLNCAYHVVHWGEEHNLYPYQFDAHDVTAEHLIGVVRCSATMAKVCIESYGRFYDKNYYRVREFRMKLNHLQYGRNNTVLVISRNEKNLQQSKNLTFTFPTPSCLNFHKNLSICTPAPVEGIEIHEIPSNADKKSIDLVVNWLAPELYPDNYTIIAQPLDCDNCSVEFNIPGNETTATIVDLTPSHQYNIGVIAESEGGARLQSKTFVVASSSAPDDSTVSIHLVIALSTLMTIFIVGMIVCTLCRYKKFNGHYCHYSFFEDISRNGVSFDVIKSPLKSSLGYDTDENKTTTRDKYEIPTDRLRVKKILGSGIGGIVKLATLQDDQKRIHDVAVKMLREDASVDDIRNFHREILLMKSAGNHRNIVSLIGCCTIDKSPILVVEYCSKGDLLSYLKQIMEETMTAFSKQVEWPAPAEVSPFLPQENADASLAIDNRLYDVQTAEALMENKISPEDLLNFARQVATGMEFLSSNRIVHRDLAARNVLVCADKTVKISDFGLSRDIYQENVYKKQSDGKLPLKWMAIEALTHQVYTSQSDVWSFGILLYEIITLGGNPYPGLQGSEILHVLKSGYRMERPPNCGLRLYDIMRSCWDENPLKRPSFNHLKLQLDKLISTMTSNEYLNLTELMREPHFRQFGKFERKEQNILTMPNIT